MVNGGFPPMKSISKSKKINSKNNSTNNSKNNSKNIDLKIKNILSDSIVKPMIELDKKKIEVVNDL
jgi:hypothetical protein